MLSHFAFAHPLTVETLTKAKREARRVGALAAMRGFRRRLLGSTIWSKVWVWNVALG